MEESIESAFKVRKGNSLRDKPWIVATFVLGLLVVILLLGNVFNFNITGNSISANKASTNLIDFAVAQGVDAKLVNVTSYGSFYRVYISVNNTEAPYLVTKDGKYFLSENYLVPLTDEATTSDTTNTDTTTTEVPKTDKPLVELFVMSYCPYGTQAEKGILPVVALLGDKIDFKLRFVYYSMHPSQGEVEENLRQYCIQKEQESKFTAYLSCFLKAGNSSACLTETKIDQTKLNACTAKADTEFQISANKNDKTKWLSGSYPLFNVDKDLNELYNVAGSPTLVINGVQVSSARDPASYLKTVCAAFSDGSIPTECSEKLSTTSYGAGFGYDTSGSTTSAQCG